MNLYISEQGAGDRTGSSKERAIAWDNGRGVEKAIDQAEANDTIVLQSGTYRLTQPIDWRKSGRYSRPIRLTGEGQEASGGQYGQSVWPASKAWPIIRGERPTQYSSDNAGAGDDFIRFQDGVENVVIEQLILENFARAIVAEGGHNEGITIQSIRADNLRQFAVIVGKSVGGERSNDWRFSRCYLSGISKRAIRADGLQDSSFYDIYADCKDLSGQLHSGDWPLLFHCEGDAASLRFYRCCGVNPSHPNDNYANGDSFCTEADSRNIRFERCIAYRPDDAGFDIKGNHHELYACYTEKVGNRAYRIWGSAKLAYCMADGQQSANGDNAAIWVNDGSATISDFLGRDMERPIAIDGKGQVQITNSRFELSRQLRDSGYTLRNQIKQDGNIKENNVKYQLT